MGKFMDEEIIEEFNERFDTIEAAQKYTSDLQAKSEFIHKRDIVRHEKEIGEIRKLQEQTQKHLDYISKVLRFNIDEYEFQEEKLVEAGNILSRKRTK